MDTQIRKYYVHVFSRLDVLYKEALGMTQQKERNTNINRTSDLAH